MAIVDRRGDHTFVQSEDAHHRLDRPRRAERVAHHRLRRRNRQLVGVVAEDFLDRLRLRQVSQRRRRAVSVDVPDTLGLNGGAPECGAHHVGDAGRLRLGLGHVMPVVRCAVPEHLRVDAGTACLCGLELLEHEHARTFSHHEPRARGVERPRCARRILVLNREPAHRREAGEDQRVHAGLAPAGEDRVGVAAFDQLRGFTDRVGAGRAGGDDCVVRSFDAQGDRQLPAGGVDQDVREKVRRDSVGPALAADLLLLEEPADASDRSAEDHADALRVEAVQPGIAHRLPGCPQGEEDVPLELTHLLR